MYSILIFTCKMLMFEIKFNTEINHIYADTEIDIFEDILKMRLMLASEVKNRIVFEVFMFLLNDEKIKKYEDAVKFLNENKPEKKSDEMIIGKILRESDKFDTKYLLNNNFCNETINFYSEDLYIIKRLLDESQKIVLIAGNEVVNGFLIAYKSKNNIRLNSFFKYIYEIDKIYSKIVCFLGRFYLNRTELVSNKITEHRTILIDPFNLVNFSDIDRNINSYLYYLLKNFRYQNNLMNMRNTDYLCNNTLSISKIYESYHNNYEKFINTIFYELKFLFGVKTNSKKKYLFMLKYKRQNFFKFFDEKIKRFIISYLRRLMIVLKNSQENSSRQIRHTQVNDIKIFYTNFHDDLNYLLDEINAFNNRIKDYMMINCYKKSAKNISNEELEEMIYLIFSATNEKLLFIKCGWEFLLSKRICILNKELNNISLTDLFRD